MRSNNIVPNFLVNNGYKFTFTLDDAMKDWKKIVLRIGSNPIKMIVFKNISKLEPFKILHEKYEEAISNKQDSPRNY